VRVTLISMVYPYPRMGFWPGIERQIGLFAAALRDAGAQVRVITSFRNGDRPREEHEGIAIYRVSDAGHRFGRLGYLLDAHVRSLAANALDLTEVIGSSDVVESFIPLPVSRVRPERRPSIFAFFAHRDRPVRWADYLHQPFHFRLEREWFRRVDAVIVASSESRRVLVEEYGVPAGRVEIIPLGVAPRFLEPSQAGRRESWRTPNRDQRLLYVGPLIPRKNLGLLIDALPALTSRGHAVRLVLAGSGPDRQGLEERARRLGVANRVEFPGFVGDEALPALYRSADLFVFPSFKEGFGQVLVEAMACGLTIVASSRAPIPEVVGDAGEFFDPMSVEDLVDALTRVLSDTKARERMSERALLRVRDLYDWNSIARRTLEFYASKRAA